MTQLINTLKAAVFPQPPVLDRETVELRAFWRSIFMQGEMGAADLPDWKVVAEVETLKHQTEGMNA
jgi:hypothetical protein